MINEKTKDKGTMSAGDQANALLAELGMGVVEEEKKNAPEKKDIFADPDEEDGVL